MAGYMDLIQKAKTFSDFKKMSPDTDITALGFQDLKKRGRKNVEKSFSEQDIRLDEAIKLMKIESMLNESGKNISDEDRARAEEKYMKRNDGGMAMSGRGKPVRTF